MIKTCLFEHYDTLVQTTETLLRKTLQQPGNLMLSGGSTPYAIYDRITADPSPVHAARTLFLSDERMVPFDSRKNNARNLEPMLDALACADRFVRVDTSLPPIDAAAKFEADIETMESVDLGFLGMGTDGHTAGFFTKEQANMKNGRLTLYTDRPDGMEGVSITPAFLKRVERIILLVTGESKFDIIQTLLTNPHSIPAGIALFDHPNVELWSDVPVS